MIGKHFENPECFIIPKLSSVPRRDASALGRVFVSVAFTPGPGWAEANRVSTRIRVPIQDSSSMLGSTASQSVNQVKRGLVIMHILGPFTPIHTSAPMIVEWNLHFNKLPESTLAH